MLRNKDVGFVKVNLKPSSRPNQGVLLHFKVSCPLFVN
jgi:hypothetical protein